MMAAWIMLFSLQFEGGSVKSSPNIKSLQHIAHLIGNASVQWHLSIVNSQWTQQNVHYTEVFTTVGYAEFIHSGLGVDRAIPPLH